jgi:hypothetical protein
MRLGVPTCRLFPNSSKDPVSSAKKIPDVGCGGTHEGKRPEFSGKSMRDACDGSLKCGGYVNLVNDVLSCWVLLLLTTRPDVFANRNVDMQSQRTFQPSRPSHRQISLSP